MTHNAFVEHARAHFTHHPEDLYRKIVSLFELATFERADAFLNEIR